MSLLSSDILHQVFKFFVSESQIVDGESLRVASLVCKQWRGIVDSKSLWAASARAMECNDNNSNSVHRSLQLKEGDGNEATLHASLIGFTNLKCYGNNFPESEMYYHVRERATGSKYLLSISGDNQKNPSLIRDLYANHFELKEDFLLRDSNDKQLMYSSQCCPLGITIWLGRVLRWYRSESENEACETIAQISSNREIKLFDQDFSERKKLFCYVRHLIDLENTYSRRSNEDLGYYAQGRQHMVDWMVEVVEVFELGDRTLFQAMLIFDRFLFSNDRLVKTSSLQLFGGACLLIASKLSTDVISEKDICFCCDNIFSVTNVIATEELVLKQLEWKLAYPSALEIMLASLKILGFEDNSRTTSLCSYILELSLMFHIVTLNYPPSVTAAAAIVLTFYCMKHDDMYTLWPDELAKVTELELKDVVDCAVFLSQQIEGARLATDRLDMIHRRYSKYSRHNAAGEPIPVLTSKTALTDYEELLRSRIQNKSTS